MSEKIYFALTEDQKEVLAPLFKQVDEALTKWEKGAIFGQIQKDCSSVATFIPEKYGIKIHKIIKEMEESERCKAKRERKSLRN